MANYEAQTTLQEIKLESLLRRHVHAELLYTDSVHGIFSVDTIEHGKHIVFTDERADTFNSAKSCMLETRWITDDSVVRKVAYITGYEISVEPVVESAGLEVTYAILHNAEPELRLIRALRRVTGFDTGFIQDYKYIDLPDIEPAYYRNTGFNKRNVHVVNGQAVPYSFAQVHTDRYLEPLLIADRPVVPNYWLTHRQIAQTGKWERVAIDVDGSPTDIPKLHIARQLTWTYDLYKFIG